MMKREFIILVALTVLSCSISAQLRPGIKAGYNFGGVMATALKSVKTDEAGNPDNFHLRSGFHAGMIADWPINNTLAIQPGIRFAMQGFSDEYKNVYSNIRTFSLYYVQIPVYAQYRLNVAEEVNLLFQAGPYASVGLFGRQSWTRNGKSKELNDNQKKIKFGGDPSDGIDKSFDYGISAGVGIELFMFQFMLNYDFGLQKSTFNKKISSAIYNIKDMRSHTFSATVAVIFGRRDPLHNEKD